MTVQLRHPATGATTTVATEKAALVHERSGWQRVATDASAAPERPAEGAPGRRWLEYAEQLGHQVDVTDFESMDDLIAHIDGLAKAPADEPNPEVVIEPVTQEPTGRRGGRRTTPDPVDPPADEPTDTTSPED